MRFAQSAGSDVLLTHRIPEWTATVHDEVRHIRKRLPPNVQVEDLVAAGTWGLVDALRRSADPCAYYVRIRVRGAILDELRAQDWLSRRTRRRMAKQLAPGEEAAGEKVGAFVSFDDLPAETEVDRGGASPFAALSRQLDYEALGKAMAMLPERELAVVQARYYEGSAIHEIAERLGVSPSRASQLHASALRRLKAALDAAEA